MATYISLVQFTDKGIQAAKQTSERVAEWSAKVQSRGVSIKQMYWTLGHYDQVCIFEAPDDETAASVLLAADMLGNTAHRQCVLSQPKRWRAFWARCRNGEAVGVGGQTRDRITGHETQGQRPKNRGQIP